MPANSRWDLIQGLKGYDELHGVMPQKTVLFRVTEVGKLNLRSVNEFPVSTIKVVVSV